MTGEAASRTHLDLPGRQEQLLEAVCATGKPVAMIVFSGRPLILPWAVEHVPSILAAWFPGIQAGPALVRTLFGENIPTGKLTMTWPRSLGQIPIYYNALNTGRPIIQNDATLFPNGHDENLFPAILMNPIFRNFPSATALRTPHFVRSRRVKQIRLASGLVVRKSDEHFLQRPRSFAG